MSEIESFMCTEWWLTQFLKSSFFGQMSHCRPKRYDFAAKRNILKKKAEFVFFSSTTSMNGEWKGSQCIVTHPY